MEIFQKNNVIICIGNISEWRKKKMKDFRIEKLANNLLTYSVNIQKGDNILIEVLGEDGIDLAKELIKKQKN